MVQFIANREQFENAVVSMHVESWSIRALQRHFGVGRNTIRRILRKHDCLRDQGHDQLAGKRRVVFRSSKLDPFVPQIKALFERYPDITGQRVFEQLQDAGYGGGIAVRGGKPVIAENELVHPQPVGAIGQQIEFVVAARCRIE